MEFQTAHFSGPLDLLLFLVKKNEVNIFDIPILSITRDYLSYLGKIENTNLEEMSDFYKWAAILLSIKIRLLLPKTQTNEEDDFEGEDPRELLTEHLIEYEKFKTLASRLEERNEGGKWIFGRALLPRKMPFEKKEELPSPSERGELLEKLRAAFEKTMKNFSIEKTLNMYEEVSVNEKITLINELLAKKNQFFFSELVESSPSAMNIICCFLAVLEGIKTKKLRLIQDSLFGEIKIIKR